MRTLSDVARRTFQVAAIVVALAAAVPAAGDDAALWLSQTVDLAAGEHTRFTLWSELRTGDGALPNAAFVGPKLHWRLSRRFTLAAGATLLLVDGGGTPYRLEIEVRPRLLDRPGLAVDSRHRVEWLDGPGRDGRLRGRHRLRASRPAGGGPFSQLFASLELFHDDSLRRSEIRFVPAGARLELGERVSVDLYLMLRQRRGEATDLALGVALRVRP